MDNISDSYVQKRQATSQQLDVKEMDDFAASMAPDPKGEVTVGEPIPYDPSAPGVTVPGKFAPRKETDDPLGRILPGQGPRRGPELSTKPTDAYERSTAGKIAENVGEIPVAIASGSYNAVMNAVDPLATLLGADSYKPIEMDTPTGQITQSISQFVTGFIPALRGLKAVGIEGRVTSSALAGAVSDFATRGGHEGRLADVWVAAGLPKNDFIEWMQTDKENPEILERFKTALEGVVPGVVLDGIILAAKYTRSMIRSNISINGPDSEIAMLRDKYGDLTDEDIAKHLGDPTKPMLETKIAQPPAVGKKVAKAVAETPALDARALIRTQKPGAKGAASQDFETYVNFSRIDEPEQVKFTIGKMAEAMKGSIDEARRGKITQEETAKMADELGMTVTELLERRKGQPLNAEEALAARQLWAASGEKLLEAAKKAAGPNAGELDQFVFRRMMAMHSAIQNEVIGARTETARALAQWKIPAGGSVEKARAIQQVMSAAGGPNETKEMARRLAILAENGANPAAIARFAQRGWGATSLDAVKEVWINGLLSSPKTHLVNISSNTGVALQQVYERAVAGGIRTLIGGDGVKAGESIAMVHGLKGAVRDAFRMAAKSLKTGETGYAFNKIDVTHPNSISAESFRMSSETSIGKFVDFLGHAATVPGRLLGAVDEFFKTIVYRMEVHAQAFRQAASEGLTGDAFAARTKELIENPPDHIRINAADAAMYSTFTNEVGWFGKAVMGLRDSGSPIGQLGITLVLPFVRTPTNIARYTFERTPFAPLVGQWRADIAAGGARADLALARMSTGTAIMMTAMDYANDGVVSGAGPSDPTQREALLRSGWQPYSIYHDGKWVSYSRSDPFGATMGFAASITEAINGGEVDQEDVDEWQEVSAMAISAVSQVAINKTYLEGVANFVEFMSDPKRYGEGYINNLVASFTPFTALSGAIETAVDPAQSETNNPWEAVQARIAGLSSKLPPRRDLWGAPIKNESGMGKIYDFLSPVAIRQQDVEPIDRAIVELGGGPQRIKKRTVFDGVPVSFKQYPEVFDEYVRLAGNDLKSPAWNMGCKDYLNAVVSGKHPMSAVWKILPDEKRRDFIEGTVRDYRKLAQQQIMADPKFAKFAETMNYLKGAKQQSKMPVFGEE